MLMFDIFYLYFLPHSEKRALTSRKYVAEETKSNPNKSNLMNYFGCVPPFFVLEFWHQKC